MYRVYFALFPYRLAGWYWRWAAAYNGRRDGERLIPAENAVDPPPYLYLICARYQQVVNAMGWSWQRGASKLRDDLTDACEEQKEAGAALERAARAEEATFRRLEELRAEADAVSRRLNPDHGYISPRGYAVTAALLAVLDLPLTFMAFQVLALAPLYTLMLSCLIVVLLTLLGHFTGHYLRHLRVGARPLLWAVLGAAALFVVSLSVMREASIEAMRSLDGASLHPVTGAVAFFAIAAVGFLIPALLAAAVRLEPLAPIVAATTREWRRSVRTLRAVRLRHTEAAREAAKAQERHDAHWRECQRACDLVNSWGAKEMYRYVAANVRARQGHLTPPGLREEALPKMRRCSQ